MSKRRGKPPRDPQELADPSIAKSLPELHGDDELARHLEAIAFFNLRDVVNQRLDGKIEFKDVIPEEAWLALKEVRMNKDGTIAKIVPYNKDTALHRLALLRGHYQEEAKSKVMVVDIRPAASRQELLDTNGADG